MCEAHALTWQGIVELATLRHACFDMEVGQHVTELCAVAQTNLWEFGDLTRVCGGSLPACGHLTGLLSARPASSAAGWETVGAEERGTWLPMHMY